MERRWQEAIATRGKRRREAQRRRLDHHSIQNMRACQPSTASIAGRDDEVPAFKEARSKCGSVSLGRQGQLQVRYLQQQRAECCLVGDIMISAPGQEGTALISVGPIFRLDFRRVVGGEFNIAQANRCTRSHPPTRRRFLIFDFR